MKFLKFATLICVMASTIVAQADGIKGYSPGYYGLPYQVGDNLPSTSENGIQKEFNQEILFLFDAPVVGQKPSSFNMFTSKTINRFDFTAPMTTVFHFVGVRDLGTCSNAKAEIEFYSAQNGSHRRTLQPGDSILISTNEKVALTFDLSDWAGCSFSELAYEYYLTGEFTYTKSMGRNARVVEVPWGGDYKFSSEIHLSKIYQPMFKYSAKEVQAPLLQAKLPQCKFSNSAQDIYDNNPMSTIQNIYATCEKLDPARVNDIREMFENINVLTVEFTNVMAQYQPLPNKQSSASAWYVDFKLPTYNYKSVVMTTLAAPYYR